MRKIVMLALVGVVVAGAGAVSLAQPAGPPPGMGQGMGPGMMHGGRDAAQPPFNRRDFALLPIPEDRKLTAPDVQRIAEGVLLWFGNRTWKVTEVKEAADNQIAFAVALPEGGVVARFAIDRKTGRLHRTG